MIFFKAYIYHKMEPDQMDEVLPTSGFAYLAMLASEEWIKTESTSDELPLKKRPLNRSDSQPSVQKKSRSAKKNASNCFSEEVRYDLEKMMLNAPTRPHKGNALTYPEEDAILYVMKKHGLTRKQVDNWMSNYRRRKQKPHNKKPSNKKPSDKQPVRRRKHSDKR